MLLHASIWDGNLAIVVRPCVWLWFLYSFEFFYLFLYIYEYYFWIFFIFDFNTFFNSTDYRKSEPKKRSWCTNAGRNTFKTCSFKGSRKCWSTTKISESIYIISWFQTNMPPFCSISAPSSGNTNASNNNNLHQIQSNQWGSTEWILNIGTSCTVP